MDTIEKNKIKKLESPIYVQLHMKGAAEMAAVFGVKRETIVQWYKEGAPIRKIGKKYQAQYGQLWDWILENAEV